ncbi:PAS domain S-box [Halosimplex carlsbadense 2-9-1]|uniref:PAS domain S-box n=1 Tax=Halosimplex carlsbadense 2-9-1 TaxID=797114 RepID=M0D526_9EURY|nr:PAS domain S-box protein [Halosimplex carlsbadense]ELZ30540.1 PAS domain S-box [Halosimplex carlsbadense 2-9-1]
MTGNGTRPETSGTDRQGYAVDGADARATLDAVASATAAGVLVVDDGRVSFANANVERYLGREPGELTGDTVETVLPDRATEAVAAVADGGAERTVAWRASDAGASADGASGAVDGGIAATVSPADGGRVAVTLTRGERDREPPSDDGVARVALDADGQIAGWSDGAAALTGWSTVEAVGADLSLLYPDDGEADPEETLASARTDGPTETEGWRLRRDGSDFWASVSVTPRRDTDGGIAGFDLRLRDRTDRKRLADERELLATVNHAIADADGFREGVETTLEAVCARTQWAYGEAWVPDAGGDALEHLVGHAESERLEPFLRASRDVTFDAAEGLPGRVWASESAEWIPDASAVPESTFRRTDTAESVGLQAALGVPIRTDDGVVAVLTFFLRERRAADEELVEAVTDVTADLGALMARKRAEEDLRTFRKAVEQAGHSVYVTDTDATIEYVNPTFERVTGYGAAEAVGADPSILNSGEHDDAFFADLWTTITDGEVWTGEVRNRRKSGEPYVVNQTIAPIVDGSGEIERFVAVNDEITDQKRRERELRSQRNSLRRIKQIIESLRPINRALARADTREAVDRGVCEGLAASEAYLAAWVGDYNAAADGITPREWAGVDDAFVEELDLGLGDGGAGDADEEGLYRRAVAEGEVQAVRDLTTAPSGGPRRERALAHGFQSQAAVPAVYGDSVLGVLTVYSARPDAFDEYERGLLAELGERVGHAINAAENRQLLHTDTVVELEFEVGARDSPTASVAGELGCRLSLNGVAPAAAGYVAYVAVDGARPEAVAEALADRDGVDGARVVEAHGETGVVEVTGGADPVAALVEHGATVRAFETTGEVATVRCEIAPRSDVETLITAVEAAGEDTVFAAKRTRDRDVRTVELTRTAVEERLTDRQREALALAYHAGFFASPRHSTGEELADVLDIASPTFYRHVREGTRKVLELLVDAEDAPPANVTRSER